MAQSQPPFGIPSGVKVLGSRWEARPFPEGISDGLRSKWPPSPYRPSDERVYQIKIAQDWAERDGRSQPGTMYYLPSLPDGYACFEMDQPAGKQIYKRLFGHPSGRFYDSIVRFEPHVWWLIAGRQGLCQCILCGHVKPQPGPPKPRKHLDNTDRLGAMPRAILKREGPVQVNRDADDESSRSSSVGLNPRGRAHRLRRGDGSSNPVDEEGTRDVWKEVVNRIHIAKDAKRGLEDDIREESSIDWLSERDTISQYFTKIEQQHSFVPRMGELVLWCPTFPPDLFLQRDLTSGQYQFYNIKDKRFVGYHPQWRGGVITSVPSRAAQNGAVDFTDLLSLPKKKTAMNTSGFRVETMPDPNCTDKSLSKQYRYVPLRNIRPLSQWQILLKGIPQKDLHSSVLYALTCMTSISLIDKWRINGDWIGGAFISARGMFLGSELITVGDTVRLISDNIDTRCTEIMVVDTIRLHLQGLETDYLDNDSKKICTSSLVTLLGRAYTIRWDRAFRRAEVPQSGNYVRPVSQESIRSIFRAVGTSTYGTWYPLHDTKQRLEVSYDRVLGRLYEAEAVRLWSGQRQQQKPVTEAPLEKPDLAFDMSSIIAGRRYATKVDERMQGPPITDPNDIRWIISDYRAQSLDVASFNGQEVGPYFEVRTPATIRAWRTHIKIANGEKVSAEEFNTAMGPRVKQRPDYRIPTVGEIESSLPRTPGAKRRGRPPGSKVIDGKLYRAGEYKEESSQQSPSIRPSMLSVTQDASTEPEFSEEDDEEEEGEGDQEDSPAIEIAETQTPYKHSSQMAGAALVDPDSEDVEDEDAEDHDDDNQETTGRALLQAYGADDAEIEEYTDRDANSDIDVNNKPDNDVDSDDDNDDLDSDVELPTNLSAWQRVAAKPKGNLHASQRQHPPKPAKPPSKSQIFKSVEQGQDSTIARIAGVGTAGDSDLSGGYYEYEEEEEEELDYDEWRNPRNARGGTEESSGGDYEDEED